MFVFYYFTENNLLVQGFELSTGLSVLFTVELWLWSYRKEYLFLANTEEILFQVWVVNGTFSGFFSVLTENIIWVYPIS